jgi:hypothetical protein
VNGGRHFSPQRGCPIADFSSGVWAFCSATKSFSSTPKSVLKLLWTTLRITASGEGFGGNWASLWIYAIDEQTRDINICLGMDDEKAMNLRHVI